MQTKTTVRYDAHLPEWPSPINPQTTSAGEDVEKGDLRALLVGMQTGQPLWKVVRSFLKKLSMELPFDPAIPLLGIYARNLETQI